ncbi:MAG TPA: TonB-dependent receptor [Burkholderiales bacterium]|nr:TonB-dependent receptor [Burkholderiales bacterium]
MDRSTPALALVAALALVGAASGRAEDPQTKPASPLQYDLVVTATRVETPGREVASSVTVITCQELLRTRRTMVLEALEDVIGLSVIQNGGPGATASVSIRGANSEHTLVLIDGVAVNDPINPSRSYDLAHLSVVQVERIEVLRGPQSPLYGSDAMGGVINIITRKGRGRPQLSLSASGGSYGTAAGEAGLSGSSGRADYTLGLSAYRTTGVSAASDRYLGNSERDGYRNVTLSGRLGYALRPNLDLDLSVRSLSARTAIDAFGGAYGDDPNSIQDDRSTMVRVQVRGLFLGQRWEQRLSVSWVGSDRRLLNPADEAHPLMSESGTYGSGLVRLDWQNNLFLTPSQTLTAGLELNREQGHSDYVSESSGETFESSFPTEKARVVGFYVQDQWKVRGAFFLAAGARLDVHSRTGAALTYRVAPAFVVERTGTKLRATLGTGFKSPSLYQLFAPPTTWGPIGNARLRAERVVGWDAGLDQDLFGRRLRLGLTYFSDSFRDLIDFDYVVGYLNIGRARTSGLELSVDSRPLGADRSLSLRAAYTRLTARNEVSGEPLLRRPRDKFSAQAATCLFGRFDLAATLLYTGPRPDRDYSAPPYPTVTLPGYLLLNAVVSAPLGRSLDLFVRLDNILGTQYEMVRGYGTLGFSLIAGFRLGR